MPVASIAGEAAVEPSRLQADSLRARFANPPLWQPEVFESKLGSDAKLTPASVLIALVAREHGMAVLFTRRTAHLNDHAGQISFPGGRAETYDASHIVTALRETEEEIGLDRSHIDVIGTMPDYVIASGYRITPVVGLVRSPFEMSADPFEVAEIFEVPLEFLMNGAHHQKRSAFISAQGGARTFYAMPYQNYFIWGATASMLRNLFHFLRA